MVDCSSHLQTHLSRQQVKSIGSPCRLAQVAPLGLVQWQLAYLHKRRKSDAWGALQCPVGSAWFFYFSLHISISAETWASAVVKHSLENCRVSKLMQNIQAFFIRHCRFYAALKKKAHTDTKKYRAAILVRRCGEGLCCLCYKLCHSKVNADPIFSASGNAWTQRAKGAISDVAIQAS